ncbi:MAG: T9SS type A sorting domain-containing protein, partial [Gemmatimonadota bacterium]|nr:T9SS type A sorting domain-containing protein [Gemmatimonadota bacterium]
AWGDIGPPGPDSDESIFIQRYNAQGDLLWGPSAIVVTGVPGEKGIPAMLPDGNGGVFVVWSEVATDDDVRGQRYDALGNPLWAPGGTVICAETGSQFRPQVTSDGGDGMIIVWQDNRNGGWDIYAQRVDSNGVLQWFAPGIPLNLSVGNQTGPRIVSDNAGGGYVSWSDDRQGNPDIFAQRISPLGGQYWTLGGLPVCIHSARQAGLQMVVDGANGAICVWDDERGGEFAEDIYAHKLIPGGVSAWTFNGVPVTTGLGAQIQPKLVADGAGGAIVTWDDGSTFPRSIYAQRITLNGARLWALNGELISNDGDLLAPAIAPDGSGGAYISWSRIGTEFDIRAQRVDNNGSTLWPPAGGVDICSAPTTQNHSQVVLSSDGNPIFAWSDARTVTPVNFALRWIDNGVAWGWPYPDIIQILDTPSDDGGFVDVVFDAVQQDLNGGGLVSGYFISRAVDQLPPPTGVWEVVASVRPQGPRQHTISVPTTRDKSPSDPAIHYYKVTVGLRPGWFYESDPDSGCSVVNTAAAINDGSAPKLLTLDGVFPNPSSGASQLRVGVPEAGNLTLEMFDARGRRLVSRALTGVRPGWELVDVPGYDASGRALASGVYFVRVSSAVASRTVRVVRIR